jgi:hypothetical protein
LSIYEETGATYFVDASHSDKPMLRKSQTTSWCQVQENKVIFDENLLQSVSVLPVYIMCDAMYTILAVE